MCPSASSSKQASTAAIVFPLFGKLSVAAWWLVIAFSLSGSFGPTYFTAVFQLVLTVRERVKVPTVMNL